MFNNLSYPIRSLIFSSVKRNDLGQLVCYAQKCFNSNITLVQRIRCGEFQCRPTKHEMVNVYSSSSFCSSSSNGLEVNEIHDEYIDYTVLPTRIENKKKKIKDCDEDVLVNTKKPITKRKISEFLTEANANKDTLKEKMMQLGLEEKSFSKAFADFKHTFQNELEDNDNLTYIIGNIDSNNIKFDEIFSCFYDYIKQRYPISEVIDELKSITNLKNPANWFVAARGMKRKIIFHAGPTNSGKTHHALYRFEESDSGIYGGPLRMLASEVYERTNKNGILCDMLTGEQRLWAKSELEPSSHVSCTVEMCKNAQEYDCAVLDEIQLLRDKDRGWGWTSAFLGIPAKEIHVCGEPAAENLLKSLVKSTGDEIEVRQYKRLTPLHLLKKSIGTLKALRPGDCIVAFSRQKLFKIRAEVERETGLKCSLIYGGLPPSVRLEQARQFNDPDDKHCVLVASDAIGMGINLNIRRLIFDSLRKFDGQKMINLPSYHAKQIAGRAGRFGTDYPQGYVTTLHQKDLNHLDELISSPSEDVQQAGIRPTFEQIEMISHLLPKAKLAEMIEFFMKFAKLDENYFMCDIHHLKKVAEEIQHIPLTLRQRYSLCSATSDRTNKSSQVVTFVIKIANYFSDGKTIDERLMKQILNWPPRKPRSLDDLQGLESIHDIFDLYLWMSYRYEEIFVDREEIRSLQEEVETMIRSSVNRIARNNKQYSDKKKYSNSYSFNKMRNKR